MSESVNDYEDLLEESEHRWRNRLVGLVVLAALVAAGAYALWALVLGDGGSSGEETQTATVERGSITNTLSTSGVVVAQSTADLSFGQSERVTAVNVTLGQEVKQGDVLAEMESGELESALVTAEVNLASAQAKLDELLAGSSESDLASADQSLLQAQANYDQAERALEDLLDGPSETELLSAELAVASAESQLAKAKESRSNLYSASDDAVAAAEEAVSKAEDALADAKRAAANATDSLLLAKVSLQGDAEAYCDTDDHIFDLCWDFYEHFSIPLTNHQINQLSDSISPEENPDADLIKATTSLISANASYKNALASKSSANAAVVSAEENIEAAQNDLEEAKKGPSSAEIASADVAVAEAQLSLDEAKEKLAELIEGPTQEDLEEAQSNLDQAAAALVVAQAKWDDVYGGPDPLDIELQRDQVRQAELSVERARDNLEDAQIIAPFDGTVAALNIEVGQEASTQQAAIILNTPDALRLDLVISESDRPEIEAGQPGFASFDAIGDIAFPFVIDSVGTNPTTTQGVVTYEAWATLQTERSPEDMGALFPDAPGGSATPPAGAPDTEDIPPEALERLAGRMETDAKPLPGMNASVTITVDQAQDVLIVPAQAIQSEGFQSVVEVLNDDGSTEKVVVQTGLSDGTNTEIIEGLEEGQTVIIPVRAATSVQATPGAGFQQRGFFREGEVPEGGGPTFFIGPGGSAP